MDKLEREALAARALGAGGSGDVEVVVVDEDRALTRFTRNAIHQNLEDRETTVRFRIVRDCRTGFVATNSLDDAGLQSAARRAAELADLAPPDPDYPGLAPPATMQPAHASAFDAATAGATPEQRASIAAEIFAVAEKHGLWAAGFVSNQRNGITVANSTGTLASFDSTECGAAIKQNGEDSTGYAECFASAIDHIEGNKLAEVAAEKALRSKAPTAVEPGTWTVIFEPAAFAELLAFIVEQFSARAFHEGSSFLSDGGLGEMCAGQAVTLMDDFSHELAPAMPFDFEGSPKHRVPLIDRGVASAIVTDRYWAKKLARENTGHALRAPNPAGPQPLNAVVLPGSKSTEH